MAQQPVQKVKKVIRKTLTRVLDSTKVGTWNIIRRPPIQDKAVIQGKPRAKESNAFKSHQKREGSRLRKAINAITHGKNIFVYHNARTNQVVYSLTRYLEKNSVIRQLVYHGKKTVPATVRKDMWMPYYSVHFKDHQVGLRAYQLLREFSMKRQLDPPREMITITEDFLNQKRPRDPKKAKEFDEEYADKLGWIMQKKHRARAVMDQKATSVADVSAVIAIQEKEIQDGFAQGEKGHLTRSARRRLRVARKREERTTEERNERIAGIESVLGQGTNAAYKIGDPDLRKKRDQVPRVRTPQDTVKILWNDIHNARWARTWPSRVQHGELELSRDHVMPGQKPVGVEILAHKEFKEKGTPMRMG